MRSSAGVSRLGVACIRRRASSEDGLGRSWLVRPVGYEREGACDRPIASLRLADVGRQSLLEFGRAGQCAPPESLVEARGSTARQGHRVVGQEVV